MCCNCPTETPPSSLPNVVVDGGGGGGGGGGGNDGGGDVEPTNFVDVCGSGPTHPNTFLTYTQSLVDLFGFHRWKNSIQQTEKNIFISYVSSRYLIRIYSRRKYVLNRLDRGLICLDFSSTK